MMTGENEKIENYPGKKFVFSHGQNKQKNPVQRRAFLVLPRLYVCVCVCVCVSAGEKLKPKT